MVLNEKKNHKNYSIDIPFKKKKPLFFNKSYGFMPFFTIIM